MQPVNKPETSAFRPFFVGNGSVTYGFPSLGSSSSLREVLEFDEEGCRAPTASENHKEAERKRRERINNHLNRLRAILPCNSKISGKTDFCDNLNKEAQFMEALTSEIALHSRFISFLALTKLIFTFNKTDKASLLAKVVQRVRDLKQQVSEIMQIDDQTLIIPSEEDEISVISQHNHYSVDGRPIVKASLCCDDRADLIPDLIEILKPLPLSPLRIDMVTLGGRMRNVVVLSGENNNQAVEESVLVLKDALKKLILRSNYDRAGDHQRLKRRKIFDQRIS